MSSSQNIAGSVYNMSAHGIRSLLSEREEEVQKLRETHVKVLEERLLERETECRVLTQRLTKLQEDFEYNVALIDERDAELATLEATVESLQNDTVEKDSLLHQSRAALSEAFADLKAERARLADSEARWRRSLSDMGREVEALRTRYESDIDRQREAFEEEKRTLQRSVLRHEEDLARLRREAAAEFEDRLRSGQAELRARCEEAVASQRRLEVQARQAAAERDAVKAREGGMMAEAEQARADREEARRLLQDLRLELEGVRAAAEARLQDLLAQVQRSERERLQTREALESQVGELTVQLHGLRAQAGLAKAEAEAERGRLQEEVASRVARVEQLESQLSSERDTWHIQRRDLEEHLTRTEAQREAEVAAARHESDDRAARLEAELRAARESLWARDNEIRALREKAEGARAQIESRREDLQALKQQLVSAGERERELQRRLLQASLRAEEAADALAADAETRSEAVVRTLGQQRDHFAARVAELEASVAAKDAELARLRSEGARRAGEAQQLRMQLGSMELRAGAEALGADIPPLAIQPGQTGRSLVPLVPGDVVRTGAPVPPPRVHIQDSLASLDLPTPSSLQSTPAGNPTNGLGYQGQVRARLQLDSPPPAQSPLLWAQGRGAEGGSAEYRGGLRGSFDAPEMQMLRAQVSELQNENGRLRSVVGAMRQDLEAALAGKALEEAAALVGAGGGRAELLASGVLGTPTARTAMPFTAVESDLAGLEDELRSVHEHVQVLQAAQDASQDPAAGPLSNARDAELRFLRGRERGLSADNLRLRKELVRERQAGVGAGAAPSATEFEALRREADRLRAELAQAMGSHGSPGGADEAMTARMARELEQARTAVKRLRRENERLMDLGNELRSELDRMQLLAHHPPARAPAPPALLPPGAVTSVGVSADGPAGAARRMEADGAFPEAGPSEEDAARAPPRRRRSRNGHAHANSRLPEPAPAGELAEGGASGGDLLLVSSSAAPQLGARGGGAAGAAAPRPRTAAATVVSTTATSGFVRYSETDSGSGPEASSLKLQGAPAPVSPTRMARPGTVGFVSERETQSQRERLRELQRKRLENQTKPKVRNYNIVNDEAARAAAAALAASGGAAGQGSGRRAVG